MFYGSWKLRVFGVLMFLLSMYSAVQATYLPESSLWQGARYYDQDNVYAYVEYAVYDTKATGFHDFFDGKKDGFEKVGSGQYIYAYQVFNLGTNYDPIATFALLGGSASAASGIGSKNDAHGGILPKNDGKSFVWRFENGAFIVNKESAFMVFSSDNGPVAGRLKLSTLSEYGEEPPVNDETPEPATMLLLAGGGMAILRKRRLKIQST